jgi:hypothetical protein
MDAKNIKSILEWCKKNETMFSIVDFLTIHILRIVSFQIEIEKNSPLLELSPI